MPRCHAALVTAVGSLYLIGGRSRELDRTTETVDTIEKYDQETDSWTLVSELINPRFDMGCVAVGEVIIRSIL